MPFLQTRAAKILWFGVVCLGFIGAGILIGKSYKEWQDSPIATSITTHPIDNLDFPVVTICPPRNSNTALYHDLVKAGNGTLSDKDKNTLKGAAQDIFLEEAHAEYAKKIVPSLHMGNMDQIFQGFHSIPKSYNQENGIEIRMWNTNGTITTPWYGEEYVEEYYREDRDFHMILELPDGIQDQVNSGSVLIELEVDTRVEEGWAEQVFYKELKEGEVTFQERIFTLHKTGKNWIEAEAECQREGGHLASVTSEEVNGELARLAGDYKVWLGARREAGKWSWSDNSTWGRYTKWSHKQGNDGDGSCVTFYGKGWDDDPCTTMHLYICQVEYTSLMRTRTSFNLTYSKGQIDFSSFHVWYNYKAASQQLLNSWKDKRMTGFRLTWRIENPTVTWASSISEVGRSIKTPGLGDILDDHVDGSSDHIYKAVLTIPDGFKEEMSKNTLVIELAAEMNKEDEVALISYKLYRMYKSWSDAEAHCKREGGQLASVHSDVEQALAEKSANGNWDVWLGGKRARGSTEWTWSDNSTWGFANFDSGNGDNDYNCLMMLPNGGGWFGESCTWSANFLCQIRLEGIQEQSLARLDMEKNQLEYFPVIVFFKSRAITKQMTNSSNEERKATGFTLKWFLKDSNGRQLTEELQPRIEDWKMDVPTPEYEQPLPEMVQLARHLRLQNFTKKEVLEKIIHTKIYQIETLNEDEVCSLGQVKPQNQEAVISKLFSFSSFVKGIPSDEDIKTGYELFQTIVFCPAMTIKLFKFTDQMLSNESARTIIQTSVNLFRSRAIPDVTSLTLAKQFYLVLASTLNLQYGNVLLAAASNQHLQAVIRNGWPFFGNTTDLVTKLLQGSKCDECQDIFQKLGNVLLYCLRCSTPINALYCTSVHQSV